MSRHITAPISAAPVAEGAQFTIGSATAFAVRREEKDIGLRIRRERRPLRDAVGQTPFLRGMQRLVLSTFGLLDGISESAELYPQHVARGNHLERETARLLQCHPENLVGLLSGLLIPIILLGFIWGLPMATQRLLMDLSVSRAFVNGMTCAVRIVGAWLGLFLCARLRVVRRLCMYRGAINKVLSAYEAHRREPTLDEAVAAEPIYHRCDAAFLLIVLTLSLIAFAALRTITLPVQILVRVLMMLVIAGVVNEPLRALENLKPGHPLSGLLAPCRAIEGLFVLEPHDQMVEVALCAFNAARENDL